MVSENFSCIWCGTRVLSRVALHHHVTENCKLVPAEKRAEYVVDEWDKIEDVIR